MKSAQFVREKSISSHYAADIPGIIGAHVELTYDLDKVDCVPTKVEVIARDGQDVETAFNL